MTYIIERSSLYFRWLEQEADKTIKTPLNKKTREAILAETKFLSKEVTQTLLGELEGVLGRHLERVLFENKLATAQPLNKKLKHLQHIIKKFMAASAALDWQTRKELGITLTGHNTQSLDPHQTAKPQELMAFEELLCPAADALERTSEIIKKTISGRVKNRGGAKRKNRQAFALEIAERIDSVTQGKIPITSTRESPFVNVLGICLKQLETTEVKDLHLIARRAVADYQKWKRNKGAKTSQK